MYSICMYENIDHVGQKREKCESVSNASAFQHLH